MDRSRRGGSGPGHLGWTRAIPLLLAIAGISSLGLVPSTSPVPSSAAAPSGSAGPSGAALSPSTASRPPVLAYYYMWFNSGS
ncbi:MAG: hypothetical protein ACXWM8_01195, partial [Candidatus Limnocylindrales bacterium]